jgi:hypothetical protein
MTWIVWSIVGFVILCGLVALTVALGGEDDDFLESDWWRDQ